MPNNNGRTPFSPSISLDSDSASSEVLSSIVETAQRRSMVPGAVSTERPTGSREIVNISDIVPDKKRETPGVTILESPQKEILKPGGIFDKYVEEKKKEYYERMDKEREKKEIEDSENENNEVNDIDKEEEEILSTITNDNKDVNVDVKGVVKDEDFEFSSDNVEEEDNEVPFYQKAKENGFVDDYEYPDSYDNLPTDEDEVAMDNVAEYPEIQESENSTSMENPENEVVVEMVVHESNTVNKNDRSYSHSVVQEAIEDSNKDRNVTSEKINFVYKADQTVEDIEKELNYEQDVPTEDERLEDLRSQISEKIRPKAKAMSLEGWTIATKSTTSNKILESTVASAGKWVLPATGICIQMREVSGQKIEYLRDNMMNTPTAARNRLRVLYEHVVEPKPQSFEAWCKSIAFADYDHLFMPLYLAAFSGSNYMPQTCIIEKGKIARADTGCGKMFLSDNMPIMKCVKFVSDETKKKFWDLYDSDRTNSTGLYASEVLPISNNFAIAFHEPTLYGVLLEGAVYGQDFRKKYDNVVSIIPYIADIYWMDHKNHKLVRCEYTKYENNASKTAKSKVIRYSKIFDTFNTDEYTNVISIINSINERYEWLTYQIPEMTCPECGRVIPAEEITASGLVFTRHRLGILANTSIN